MNLGSIEMLLPAFGHFQSELAFAAFQEHARNLGLSPKLRRRLVSVGMELVQNIHQHRAPGRVALLRLVPLGRDRVQIQSFNLAQRPVSEKLASKFHFLQNSAQVRKIFQEKLQDRTHLEASRQGDFGLEICFRLSEKKRLRQVPADRDLDLVFLQFELACHD